MGYLKPAAAAAFLTVFCFGGVMAGDRITGRQDATRSEVIAANGMVATSQPLATQVGLDILKSGGNAVDAAIAANAALGLMEPTGSGIGGDLFAIVWDAKARKLYGLNASGRSPKGLTFAKLQAELDTSGRDGIPPYGVLPVSVPGAVDGWFELHNKFGKLPMKKILQPAIEYAEKGFPLTELIAHYWKLSQQRYQDVPGAFAETYLINGEAPAKGQVFRNPDLAKSYRLLASKGRKAFYEGEIADRIDRFMKANGGYLRKADLESHTSEWVQPASVKYRGYEVFELPPNGQGIAALQMLQILKHFDLAGMGFNSADSLHVLIEAKKLAYEDRAKFYVDPDFADIPLDRLLSEQYGAERAKLIGERAASRVEPGVATLEEGDTIYLTTADQDGNMVSLIQSNYRGMGSGVVVPGTGFMLQDRGQLFSMDPDHANVYAPGKRPFHTIIPAFAMKDGEPWLSFGVMGGAMQPQGHVQILVNMIDYGMNLQEAGDAARWQHFGSTEPTEAADKVLQNGGYTEVESGIPYDVVRDLSARGHKLRYGVGGYGGYQAILHDPEAGVYYGASESRKDGQAAGY